MMDDRTAEILDDAILFWWGAFRSLSAQERSRLHVIVTDDKWSERDTAKLYNDGVDEPSPEVDRTAAGVALSWIVDNFDSLGIDPPQFPKLFPPGVTFPRLIDKRLVFLAMKLRDTQAPTSVTDLFVEVAIREGEPAVSRDRPHRRKKCYDRYRTYFQREIPRVFGVDCPRTIDQWHQFIRNQIEEVRRKS